jgi:glutathione S-transferase
MLPRSGPERRRALHACALATGLADKAVSLFYEGFLHETPSQVWIDRCRGQIADVLTALETDRAAAGEPWWLGDAISHVDIAVGCALGFVRGAHGDLFDAARWPRLARHSAACEALSAFRTHHQPITVTMAED